MTPTLQRLDATQQQQVTYCVADWVKALQIRRNVRRPVGRIAPEPERAEAVAVVGYGPSLADTWEQIRGFPFVITCSGAHRFLVERGIIPWAHVEVDPRPHKVALIGPPQSSTRYYIASCCHPDVFEHLEGFDVRLWHVWDATEEGFRTLPNGEWCITGGCSVGLRALTIAGFLGFRDLHVFGFDGNYRDGQSHGAAHPNAAKSKSECEYPPGSGRLWLTTPAFLEAARQTWHELDMMPSVRATFYGEGLVQAMAKQYVPTPPKGHEHQYAVEKPALISEEYRVQNRLMHERVVSYGSSGEHHAKLVTDLCARLGTTSVLDYGAGKGLLARALPFPIWEYDPAIPGKDEAPRPADIVVCTDVLEHVEPERLLFVLADLARCVKQVGFLTINTGPAIKTLPDGRNTHLIQQPEPWWRTQLGKFFAIGKVWVRPIPGKAAVDLAIMVAPKPKAVQRRWHVLERLVKDHGWTAGLEVGVKDGRTFLHVLQECPTLHLVGVDLFAARPGLEADGGESFDDVDWPAVEAQLHEQVAAKFARRAVLITGESLAIAEGTPDRSLDFVFIDADHREASVRADIAAWRPKIRPGGMLLGHDMQPKFPGVVNAVTDLCPGWRAYADSVWGVSC